ncbi:hypothetical protein ACIBTZ_21530 [Micromonospora sp. NPDC049460]|uniref:hypothetical protein n=1 Tax=Micromonospora sp. NPDC049460 TaxID=3364272 RepID=UPI0037981952
MTVWQATNWITRAPDTLTDEHQAKRHTILDRCPPLREAADIVSSFAVIIVNLRGHDLPGWLDKAEASTAAAIRSFALGLG